MRVINFSSSSTIENVVTYSSGFEHDGLYGRYLEIVDEGNGGMFVSSEFHYNGIDGYLIGGDWQISGELSDSFKEGLNKLFNAGI